MYVEIFINITYPWVIQNSLLTYPSGKMLYNILNNHPTCVDYKFYLISTVSKVVMVQKKTHASSHWYYFE